MIKLDQKLIKQNPKIYVDSDLLKIKELEKLGKDSFSDSLSRIGVNSHLKQVDSLVKGLNKLKAETECFDQERVFHITQIKSIAKKYHLKFLDSFRYEGSIDKDVPAKIDAFEINHNIKLQSDYEFNYYGHKDPKDSNNSYILAPAKSFKLDERPKDPLLFYKINQEYYYLIHKWGNDLNPLRRLFPFLSTNLFNILSFPLIGFLVGLIVCFIFNANNVGYWSTCTVLFILGGFIAGIIQLESNFRWVHKNDWRSPYKE